MALLDATVRLLPGVMGNSLSGESESFAHGLLEYPQYTRPQVWEGQSIPDVLTSGDHGRVARWREDEARRITAERRPDLLPGGTVRPK
jgi:tRNA (guanine37-N1)-methyltransferase